MTLLQALSEKKVTSVTLLEAYKQTSTVLLHAKLREEKTLKRVLWAGLAGVFAWLFLTHLCGVLYIFHHNNHKVSYLVMAMGGVAVLSLCASVYFLLSFSIVCESLREYACDQTFLEDCEKLNHLFPDVSFLTTVNDLKEKMEHKLIALAADAMARQMKLGLMQGYACAIYEFQPAFRLCEEFGLNKRWEFFFERAGKELGIKPEFVQVPNPKTSSEVSARNGLHD